MSNKSAVKMIHLSIVGEHCLGNTSQLLAWLSIKMNGKLENDSLPPGEYQFMANGNYTLGKATYSIFARQEDATDYFGLSRVHRGTNGWIIELDLTKITSLESLEKYYNTTKESLDRILDGEDAWGLILVGTKADLAPNDRLPKSTIEEFAKSNALPYFETTTDASATIQEAFDTIIGAVVKRFEARAARQREEKAARRKKARCVVM